jgi:GAF domain-containing protein
MPAAAIPANEAERLAALHELLILDTPPEERFDRVIRFAAEEFDMPMAVMSLVDDERNWFKSVVGLDVCEVPRDIAFCSYAILQAEPLVVEDASLDPRFSDNPLVTGGPGLRFYAGVQLASRGQRIGTLCVLDVVPRRFDATDVAILRSLRTLVQDELERRTEVA